MDFSEWARQIEKERREKDESFIINPDSPIPLESRFRFEGLRYYPPDFDYRFELDLHEHKEKKILETEDSTGQNRQLINWGEFRFKIDHREFVIQAYKNNPETEKLFIPFRDATNGDQTYGAGRYLDLFPGRDRTAEGKWILDFNKAYNPFCAYNKSYSCSLIPSENYLELPIPAGEKNAQDS